MCAAVKGINPAIAKDLKNGNLLCLICNIQVKSKVWIAHSKGRKHHDNIELLKKSLTFKQNGVQSQEVAQPVPSTSMKRAAVELQTSASPAIKKRKEELTSNDDSTSYGSGATPWQKVEKADSDNNEKFVSKNIIAGVPEGFFDDEKMDNRVEKTLEKQAKLEEAYAAFKDELEDATNEQEREEDVEEETFNLERDVSNINEHINGWKTLNRLEIHREEITASVFNATTASTQKDEEMSDEEDTDPLSSTAWRSKLYS